mmetsp:Transcript_21431/g.43390  ORF Transcript_21431/g.43390 Transcript_21431/m.43390 type:complete len:202 (+) Transcript_21431:2068-2673(+)
MRSIHLSTSGSGSGAVWLAFLPSLLLATTPSPPTEVHTLRLGSFFLRTPSVTCWTLCTARLSACSSLVTLAHGTRAAPATLGMSLYHVAAPRGNLLSAICTSTISKSVRRPGRILFTSRSFTRALRSQPRASPRAVPALSRLPASSIRLSTCSKRLERRTSAQESPTVSSKEIVCATCCAKPWRARSANSRLLKSGTSCTS